jgi:hypothetical protein
MRAVFDLFKVIGGRVVWSGRKVKTHKDVGQYLKVDGDKHKILDKRGRRLTVI